MKKILQSKNFWILFVIFSLMTFFVLVSNNKKIHSESDILIIAKSELAAENFDRIVGDIAYIPHTLSFYDKMIADNDSIIDNSKDLSSFERKLSWESAISTKKIKDSGVIQIDVSSQNGEQAQIISKQIGLTLASYLSRMYDIKADVDLRIIDGPITYYSSRYSFLLSLLLSILVGFLISFPIYWIFSKLLKMKEKAKNISLPVSLAEMLKNKTKEPIELSYEEEKIAPVLKTTTTSVKAVAPANLPIADETTLASLGSIVTPKEELVLVETPKEIIIKEPTPEEVKAKLEKISRTEPTPEEVKERLNKLLSGEF